MTNFLRRGVGMLRSVIADWVIKGSSPFIHYRLYKTRLPEHTQDAYMMLCSYLTRVPETEEMVLRIVLDRMTQLVEEQPADGAGLGTFNHVSRVQALLIHIITGLFDGDIRLRRLAENQLPTLASWNAQMWESARTRAQSRQLLLGSLMDGQGGSDKHMKGPVPRFPEEFDTVWQAWILSESVRRTWLVAGSVQAAYRRMKENLMACHGGVMFTTREGVWEATSALSWTKLCAETDVGFMPHAQTQRLFTEKRPDEVDAFGKLMLESTFGVERMEAWGLGVE
jgi:hypothetical protein